MITTPGLVHDMDEQTYHADPVGGSLSSTEAKQILRSPAHLQHYRTATRSRTPAFDFGTAVHSMVLGDGAPVARIDADSWRTKAAKEERELAEQRGAIALLDADFDKAERMTQAVLDHPEAAALLTHGHPEVSAFGKHDSGVWLRGRFDWLVPDGTLVDLKTCQSADPTEFHRTAASLGYGVQAAHYRETFHLATGKPAPDFLHVLVEKEPPHLVSVAQLSDDFLDIGHMQLERAIQRYAEALRTGEWPGYPPTVHEIDPPAWLAIQEQDDEEEISI